MNKKSQHVISNKTGRWSVRKSDASRASRVFDTQKEAIDYARERAIKGRTEIYIHRKDGTIIEKQSYSKDACELKDKKR